jgi:trehalose synthase
MAMSKLEVVQLSPQSLDHFEPLVGTKRYAEAEQLADHLRERLHGRVIWNISSTARGGGVAEMLRYLVGYGRGVGLDTRWVVIDATPDFFRVTKRLHNALHGVDGDGGALGDEERAIYDRVTDDNAHELLSEVKERDVVILHDPQTAGLIPPLVEHGAIVIWRCHIGHDESNDKVEEGWAFLAPYLGPAHRFVFSRFAYVPDYCDHGRSTIITPSIDPFSPKNQHMDASTVHSILVHTGLVEGPNGENRGFVRDDGSPGRVEHSADVVRLGRAPSWKTPLIVQVSRWDHLKDPLGVIEGFARYAGGTKRTQAHLLLAGPNVRAVADDPEGAIVFEEVEAAWRELPHSIRRRVHLASLPMHDVEENGAIVNALQRHATVVVQKSLHEGFGLTVTEAMWKARPVVASAVGGIQDQIEDGKNGLLVRDPTDLEEFASKLQTIRENRMLGARLAKNARETVRRRFLGFSSLMSYGALIASLDDEVFERSRAAVAGRPRD